MLWLPWVMPLCSIACTIFSIFCHLQPCTRENMWDIHRNYDNFSNVMSPPNKNKGSYVFFYANVMVEAKVLLLSYDEFVLVDYSNNKHFLKFHCPLNFCSKPKLLFYLFSWSWTCWWWEECTFNWSLYYYLQACQQHPYHEINLILIDERQNCKYDFILIKTLLI